MAVDRGVGDVGVAVAGVAGDELGWLTEHAPGGVHVLDPQGGTGLLGRAQEREVARLREQAADPEYPVALALAGGRGLTDRRRS